MNNSKTRTKKKLFFNRALSFGMVFFIVLIFIVKMYQMFSVDLLMKDLLTLQQQKMKLVNETARLDVEVSRLKNIDRIQNIAEEKLNLITNNERQLVLELKDHRQMHKLAKKYSKEKRTLNLAGVH